jgi:hypothetical protein
MNRIELLEVSFLAERNAWITGLHPSRHVVMQGSKEILKGKAQVMEQIAVVLLEYHLCIDVRGLCRALYVFPKSVCDRSATSGYFTKEFSIFQDAQL